MSVVPSSGPDRVLTRRTGPLGVLVLNRPEAINALDLAMIRALRAALEDWLARGEVTTVLLTGAGRRGLCAGGDIRAVREGATSDPESVRTLWREEYELDALIAGFPVPVVTLADGITMGGGMGLASHATVRVVTERSRLAMPEVAIGLAPDVGGLHLLSRSPGESGTHLALTAGSVGAGDAIALGLADVAVRSSDLARLVDRAEHEKVSEILGDLALGSLPTPVLDSAGWVDECYAGDDLAAIHQRLSEHPHPDARAAASTLSAMSPTALAVTLDGLRRAHRDDSLASCLVNDLRRCSRFLSHPDLVEGIRAKIVDKDGAPRWQPDHLDAVRDLDVASYRAPLEDDLDLSALPLR